MLNAMKCNDPTQFFQINGIDSGKAHIHPDRNVFVFSMTFPVTLFKAGVCRKTANLGMFQWQFSSYHIISNRRIHATQSYGHNRPFLNLLSSRYQERPSTLEIGTSGPVLYIHKYDNDSPRVKFFTMGVHPGTPSSCDTICRILGEVSYSVKSARHICLFQRNDQEFYFTRYHTTRYTSIQVLFRA